MKPVVSGGRAIPSQKYMRAGLQCSELREFVPLSDLTETLLCAYDGVARAAYQKFMDRGARVGGELEDCWRPSKRFCAICAWTWRNPPDL